MVVSELFMGAAEGWPTSKRNFPSPEILIACRSFAPFPVIQMLPAWSTKMLCSELGQSNPWPGPPQDLSRLPSASNTRTGGAETQHSDAGGVCAAPRSSLVFELGRCITQI